MHLARHISTAVPAFAGAVLTVAAFSPASTQAKPDFPAITVQSPDSIAEQFLTGIAVLSATVFSLPCDSIAAATQTQQQRKGSGRSMLRRSGQSGSVRLVGKKWYGRYWRDVPGKEKREQPLVILGQKSSMTKPEARRKLMEIIEAEGINKPQHLEKVLKPAVTFDSIADAWESKSLPLLHDSSRAITPSRLRNHVRPFFGNMPIEDIRTGTVNDWIRSLAAKKLKPKTIHNVWKDFRAIVNWHRKQMDERKVTWYPDLPALPDEEQRWFTPEETSRGQSKVLFHLAASTGCRAGELFGLHADDVDFKGRIIKIVRSVWNGREVPTKTRTGYREVFIDSETASVLKAHLGGRTTGLVFPSKTGSPLHDRDVVRRVLYPLCDSLKIERGGMHAFRHGRVSLMRINGAPEDLVKRQIGHSSLRTTSGYTHFSKNFQMELAEKLSWTQCAKSDSLPVAVSS